jgi:hypothetical protein
MIACHKLIHFGTDGWYYQTNLDHPWNAWMDEKCHDDVSTVQWSGIWCQHIMVYIFISTK